MKNKYNVKGNEVHIEINCKGSNYNVIVSLDDFEKVNSISGTWYGHYAPSNKSIYAVTFSNRKETKMHRFLLDDPKGKDIDHINHNTLDNRRENLRICERFENAQNRKRKKYRNVYWHKGTGKYQVIMSDKNKPVYVGIFETEEEADKAAKEYRKNHYKFSNN